MSHRMGISGEERKSAFLGLNGVNNSLTLEKEKELLQTSQGG